jgi:hypothetical protein
MRDKCLLHERASVVADTVRKILDLSLGFRAIYPKYQVGNTDFNEGIKI